VANIETLYKYKMNKEFLHQIYEAHKQSTWLPVKQDVVLFINELFSVLFPPLCNRYYHSAQDLDFHVSDTKKALHEVLRILYRDDSAERNHIYEQFFLELPQIYSHIIQDALAIVEGDPAAKDIHEVMASYPGFYAIAVYRVARFFYQKEVAYLPRILTEMAHEKTGIDIHPGALIGKNFCIDHGTGIVIGGTTIIGDNVKIYQGVTLGALSVAKDMASQKRHPTIEDYVVIYSGATILGGDTTIGHHSVIGGNVWLVESVPPYSKVYHSEKFVIK